VVLGAVAVLFLALKSANLLSLNFDKTYTVSARFDNIGGLKPQAAVRSAGVVVGRVSSISFDDTSFQATVKLEMQEQFKFPKDSSIKILTSGLLGEQYLGVEPGAEEATWVAGDVVTQTQSALVLENLISQFLFSKAEDKQ
jgi:phospholipid/cholesterol/gamma-HCH transport system substrate-binding protein